MKSKILIKIGLFVMLVSPVIACGVLDQYNDTSCSVANVTQCVFSLNGVSTYGTCSNTSTHPEVDAVDKGSPTGTLTCTCTCEYFSGGVYYNGGNKSTTPKATYEIVVDGKCPKN